MLYQCAPEPEDVIASRRLSDGRALCVFASYDEPAVTSVEEDAVYEYVAGQVRVSMAYKRLILRAEFPRRPSSYALAITDDTEIPEKWRTLHVRKAKRAALRLFENFREGDDDRRRQQTDDHPSRRASDGKMS